MKKQENESDKQEKSKMAQIPEKYQALCNLQYVRDDKTRKELMALIDELLLVEGLKLVKTNSHDLSVRWKGRQVVKVCPLKKAWSASFDGGRIQRYTSQQVLEKVKSTMSTNSMSVSDADKALIGQLEERIGKLSENSKGISLRGLRVSEGVQSWIRSKGFRLQGSVLIVK